MCTFKRATSTLLSTSTGFRTPPVQPTSRRCRHDAILKEALISPGWISIIVPSAIFFSLYGLKGMYRRSSIDLPYYMTVCHFFMYLTGKKANSLFSPRRNAGGQSVCLTANSRCQQQTVAFTTVPRPTSSPLSYPHSHPPRSRCD